MPGIRQLNPNNRAVTLRALFSACLISTGLLGLYSVALAQNQNQDQVQIPASPRPALIAIVIDDLGYRRLAGERATRLPGAVTLSVLPYSPHAQALASAAITAGKELMLHAPMEPGNQVPWEENGLSSSLSHSDMRLSLLHMLGTLPQATGVNNHMGSKLTKDKAAMGWLMVELKQRDLFFVDSLTTPASLAWSSAQEFGVPSVKRDIFLDNLREPEAIKAQLQKLVNIARQRGYALAIGHPYNSTMDVLELYLPQLSVLGVELVPVSHLIAAASMTGQPLTAQTQR